VRLSEIPFGTTDWSTVERTEHKGETGVAYWRIRQFGDIRVRMVEYSPGYFADHWCTKGHILLCLEGELHTELADGRTFVLTQGSVIKLQIARNHTVLTQKLAQSYLSWIDGRRLTRLSSGPSPAYGLRGPLISNVMPQCSVRQVSLRHEEKHRIL
jgi:hypothetical protein